MPDQAVVINVVASKSNAGKTTLLEKLVPELLSRGLEVAVLKGKSRRIDLDKPGKDTWRYLEAGAKMAGIITPERYMLTGKADNTQKARETVHNLLQGVDLILVEGDKSSDNPKIEVMGRGEKAAAGTAGNVIAVVTDEEKPESYREAGEEIPCFKPDDIAEIAHFICSRYFGQTGKAYVKERYPQWESFTHFDPRGRPRMVDVSAKEDSLREAYARGEIAMDPSTLAQIEAGTMRKGDVLAVAQVAAVMAVKETGRLIPMAHPLGVSAVEVDFNYLKKESVIEIGVRVRYTGQTGVEMEALTGVSIAALTIYDMCKAVDKDMVIQNIRLEEKKGGRSGHYRRK